MTCKPCAGQDVVELDAGLEGGVNRQVSCNTGEDANCSECCSIFTDPTRRERFGYQLQEAACECHDICVQDVRDICVSRRTKTQVIPCRPDGIAGCRGGRLPALPSDFQLPTVRNFRVLCAEECLSPGTNCDRIINEIEFEIVISYGDSCFGVVTPRDSFECFFHEFARFPSGDRFPNTQQGLNQWRDELALIDGSCKVIIFEDVRIVAEGNDCVLVIDYKVIDKLWKNENLLVSALRPYPENVTVDQKFAQGHEIGPCPGGPCNAVV
ncbi:MAG: hypothetical protein GX779_00895 [Clostridia bacterium]|jgi:hypothetical protein|nr:hypothetical protein [Clostridia bacterium]